jgi:hypothetical protein
MNIFIICPVREVTEEEKRQIEAHVFNLEMSGCKVHWPQRDTNQNDLVGLNICTQNKNAIINADEIHVYWNSKSTGSLFDFGMAFSLGKPIRLINDVKKTPHKSFENVLLELEKCGLG